MTRINELKSTAKRRFGPPILLLNELKSTANDADKRIKEYSE
jgi:hypothetical protein